MTSSNDSADFDLIFSDSYESTAPDIRRLVIRAVILTGVLVVVAAGLVYWALGERERQLMGDLRQRAEILSATRSEVIKTWLDGLGNSGHRLSRSDLFRLFAAEVGLSGGVPAQNSPLAAQMPYMERAVTDYAREQSLIGAYLVGQQGRAILASSAAPSLTQAQRDSALAVFKSKSRSVSAARLSRLGLTVDVMLPVAPPQDPNPASPSTVAGVFVFATPVDAALGEILKPSPLTTNWEKTRLIQRVGQETVELDPSRQPALIARQWTEAPAAGKPLDFASRRSAAGATEVFAAGAWVPGMPWLAIHEIGADQALQPLRRFAWGVIAFAAVVTLLLVAAFTAFWWRQATEHAQALAGQYRELGGRINAQKRFLENVMGTLTDMVGLKSTGGSYVYVNPAFAKAVDKRSEEVSGLGDREVFGRGTAEGLAQSDGQVVESGEAVMLERLIHLPGGARHLQFIKVPYREESGETSGILSVARDVTELREAEARRQVAFQQMTRALVRTIETVDPFLAGHTQNVHEVGLALAEAMGLTENETATIGITSMLAQIGKVSIPKEIVAKTERLTPEEFEIMKSHIEHALEILKGVDFDLPVVDTLSQVYERLDGSGYPKGISGDQINLPARILGVADVFCARIEPRSYRQSISADETVKILADNSSKYDSQVVDALREFLGTVAGEKLLARIQATG